jgi:hypothetical protein
MPTPRLEAPGPYSALRMTPCCEPTCVVPLVVWFPIHPRPCVAGRFSITPAATDSTACSCVPPREPALALTLMAVLACKHFALLCRAAPILMHPVLSCGLVATYLLQGLRHGNVLHQGWRRQPVRLPVRWEAWFEAMGSLCRAPLPRLYLQLSVPLCIILVWCLSACIAGKYSTALASPSDSCQSCPAGKYSGTVGAASDLCTYVCKPVLAWQMSLRWTD